MTAEEWGLEKEAAELARIDRYLRSIEPPRLGPPPPLLPWQQQALDESYRNHMADKARRNGA